MRTTNSSTGRAAKYSMSKEEKMLKTKQLVFMVTAEESISNGKLSILIRLRVNKLRDSAKNGDSISIDHSTSDQDCHSKEYLSALVPTMLPSRDGETTKEPSNGTLMVSPRPSRTTTGNLIHLTSKEMVAHPTSDVLLPTQDGGNSSDTKVLRL
jgi:hypothetical protein